MPKKALSSFFRLCSYLLLLLILSLIPLAIAYDASQTKAESVSAVVTDKWHRETNCNQFGCKLVHVLEIEESGHTYEKEVATASFNAVQVGSEVSIRYHRGRLGLRHKTKVLLP